MTIMKGPLPGFRWPTAWSAVPLLKSCKQCAWLAAATLVLLRLAIGIHFFQEGTGKLADSKPFSASFFSNAKGPLAPLLKAMVWDSDGRLRLGLPAENNPSFAGYGFTPDPNPTLSHWEAYRDRVASHYDFDKNQIKEAQRITKSVANRYQGHLKKNNDEIEEYYHQLIRRDERARLPERNLDSLKTHDARNQGDWMKLRGPLLASIDRMWSDLERQLNEIATAKQRDA